MPVVVDKRFKVPVREIPTHRHIEVDGPFVAATLAGLTVREVLEPPAEDPAAGRAVVDVDLYADGTTIFANGSIKGTVRVACGRCVGPADIAFEEQLRVTYLPKAKVDEDDARRAAAEDAKAKAGAGKDAKDDEGLELDDEDMDLFPYDGDVVDLEPLIKEQLILAVPYAPLCREDCLGLCAQCGADLNQGSCGCEKPIDPRFEALKGLKLPT